MSKKWRLAYLVSHPIQYQAPLLRLISAEPDIDLTVFFCSDFSLRTYQDREFGQSITWDIPLTEGYRHEFLPSLGGGAGTGILRPVVHGLARRLRERKFDALWMHGWGHWSHVHAAFKANDMGVGARMGALESRPRRLQGERYGRSRAVARRGRFASSARIRAQATGETGAVAPVVQPRGCVSGHRHA
jgi:hypothetical protein